MEYKINLINNGFYFPLTERWIIDTFHISLEAAIIYQMILNKGYVVWTLDWLSKVMGYSKSKLVKQLNYMVNEGILIRHTMPVGDSSRTRTIYVAAYTKEGKRSEDEIKVLISQGRERLLCDYGEKRYYKRKTL